MLNYLPPPAMFSLMMK